MRDIAAAVRFLSVLPSLVAVSLVLGVTALPTNGTAAERRAILAPEADYSGHDFNTLKGVDLAACQAACMADESCQAFTFNRKAGWCFLKSDFGTLSAAPGSISGRIVDAPVRDSL